MCSEVSTFRNGRSSTYATVVLRTEKGNRTMPYSNERQAAQQREDDLVLALRDIVTACQSGGTETERFAAIEAAFGGRSETLIAQCQEHLASTTAREASDTIGKP
jgi:NADH:ubiquinone oxidoreductase subunit F (NADH-binding)